MSDLMDRYQKAVGNLHTVMIYSDAENLIAEAIEKAYASPASNNEFVCAYLEKSYRDILSGEVEYPIAEQ